MPVSLGELPLALCTVLGVDAPPRPTLSPLALEVLQLIGPRGMTEREAAELLHYSRAYIRAVLAESYRLLGVKNARQAIYVATRSGLIS